MSNDEHVRWNENVSMLYSFWYLWQELAVRYDRGGVPPFPDTIHYYRPYDPVVVYPDSPPIITEGNK